MNMALGIIAAAFGGFGLGIGVGFSLWRLK